MSELKNHYPVHYIKDGNPSDFLKNNVQIPQVSEDNKTLISFDKHLDKSVISQLVVTTNDLENYQKVQTKTEPKDCVLTEEISAPEVKVYVVEFADANITKNV